jgi:hypothetical protein
MHTTARFVYLMDFAMAALGLDALLRPLRPRGRAALRAALKFTSLVLAGMALTGLPLVYQALFVAEGDKAKRAASAMGSSIFHLLMLGGGIILLQMRRHRYVRQEALALSAYGLIFLDLASQGAYIDLEPNDPTSGFHHPEAINFLKSDPNYFRLDTGTGVWGVWQELADYRRFWDIVGLKGLRSSRLYDFTNAKYVIGKKDVVLYWEKFVPVFNADPEVKIYLNTKALPRAQFIHRAISVPDHTSALEALKEPGFDPSSEVIVEGGKPLDVFPEGASLDFVAHAPNELVTTSPPNCESGRPP